MEVTKYNPVIIHGVAEMDEYSDGDWVSYDDHYAIRDRLNKSKQENSELRAKLADIHNAEPIYQYSSAHDSEIWVDCHKVIFDAMKKSSRRVVYDHPPIPFQQLIGGWYGISNMSNSEILSECSNNADDDAFCEGFRHCASLIQLRAQLAEQTTQADSVQDEDSGCGCSNCEEGFPCTFSQSVEISRDAIKEIFLRNGFTVKEGMTDLKEYVYSAAYELVAYCKQPTSVEISGGGDVLLNSLDKIIRWHQSVMDLPKYGSDSDEPDDTDGYCVSYEKLQDLEDLIPKSAFDYEPSPNKADVPIDEIMFCIICAEDGGYNRSSSVVRQWINSLPPLKDE